MQMIEMIYCVVLQHATEEWTEAKQALREQKSKGSTDEGASLPGQVIKIKELEDAVLPKAMHGNGVGGMTAAPAALVIDCSKRASVFFRCE
jgi:hypothetical protein